MKSSILKLLAALICCCLQTTGQDIVGNTCDSTILTRPEYEKCRQDSIFTENIKAQVNYTIRFKTEILPRYRLIRKELIIPVTLQYSLDQLKRTYDSVLNNKISGFQTDMDKNQRFVQPKAYLSSLMALQMFRFYPDVYAIMLNEVHLQLKPKTEKEALVMYKQLINHTHQLIPAELYQKLEKVIAHFNSELQLFNANPPGKLFQEGCEPGLKLKCDVINFLLWAE